VNGYDPTGQEKPLVNASHVQPRVDPAHPACLILLIDESASMGGGLAGSPPSKADATADAIERYLGELAGLCARPAGQPLPLFEVGLIAYADPVSGPPISLVDRICDGLRDETTFGALIRILADDPGSPCADGGAAVTIWRRATGGRADSLVAAFRYARDRAGAWCDAHPDSPPPVAIHITDAVADPGEFEPAARELTALGTSGGPLRLFHLHLASTPSAGNAFPAPDASIDHRLATRLIDTASVLPSPLRARAEDLGVAVSPRARGLVFDADQALLGIFFAVMGAEVRFGPFTLGLESRSIAAMKPTSPEPSPPPVDRVQFTVYHPKSVRPEEWRVMLAYAHPAERRPDADPREPAPIETVQAMADSVLAEHKKLYQQEAPVTSLLPIPRESEVTFLPVVAGVEFDPERRVFSWTGEVHEERFLLRASSDLLGKTARGRMSVYLGAILLADVDLVIAVGSGQGGPAPSDAPDDSSSARPYRRVFASYSHQDIDVVEQYERYLRSLGDEYLRDVYNLRAGELWNDAIPRLIRAADVFQLFWSTNAMNSPFVRQEWEYALSLDRPFFIRPTYWEVPLPRSSDRQLPPESLLRLQFHWLHTADAPGGSRGVPPGDFGPATAGGMTANEAAVAPKSTADTPGTLVADEQTLRALLAGISKLAAAAKINLGPAAGGLEVSFDVPGMAWEESIGSDDEEHEDPGIRLVKEAAARTVESAGGGSATTIVLAEALFRGGLEALTSGVAPAAFVRGMTRAVDLVIASLKAQSRTISGKDQVAQVAGVAAGNDAAVGAMVADAFERVGANGAVIVEEGECLEDALDFVDGMRFDGGALSPEFLAGPPAMEAILEDAYLLIREDTVSRAEDLRPILEKVAATGKPLIIIAADVEREALTMLIDRDRRGSLKVCAVRAPGSGWRRKAMLEDIAVLTGGKAILEGSGVDLADVSLDGLGRAGKIVIDADATKIIDWAGSREAIGARGDEIRRAISGAASDEERAEFEQRLAMLIGVVARIIVGAEAEFEREEKRIRVAAAARATRAALAEGVLPGGGVALLRAASGLSMPVGLSPAEEAGYEVVVRACSAPLCQIAENAGRDGSSVVAKVALGQDHLGYDALKDEYTDLFAAGIVDPTRVICSALQNAATSAMTLLTSDR
jgi:chaperonin GroEL